uniref:Uncharacterized protein n=1 Tax=Anopheles culicifacies TaxID=139723 RepID=A0A182LZ80_9DIPT
MLSIIGKKRTHGLHTCGRDIHGYTRHHRYNTETRIRLRDITTLAGMRVHHMPAAARDRADYSPPGLALLLAGTAGTTLVAAVVLVSVTRRNAIRSGSVCTVSPNRLRGAVSLRNTVDTVVK